MESSPQFVVRLRSAICWRTRPAHFRKPKSAMARLRNACRRATYATGWAQLRSRGETLGSARIEHNDRAAVMDFRRKSQTNKRMSRQTKNLYALGPFTFDPRRTPAATRRRARAASSQVTLFRSSHFTATLLPNGNVLVLGGNQTVPPGGGGAPRAPVSVDNAEVYDAANAVFRTAGKLLTGVIPHSASLLANGTVLVAGGYSHGFDGDAQPEWDTMSATELFNLATSVSTAAVILEVDRADHVPRH